MLYLWFLFGALGAYALYDWIDDENNNDGNFNTAGSGNDVLTGTEGKDLIEAGNGNDLLSGLGDDDLLFGEGGKDTVEGGAGDDLVSGGAWDDSLEGGSGDDLLDGGPGKDELHGGSGDDALFGRQWDDSLDGGAGSDFLSGGPGADTLNGGTGDDLLLGVQTNNADATVREIGEEAQTDDSFDGFEAGLSAALNQFIADLPELQDTDTGDELFGGDGDDTLLAGRNDTLTGGNGADVFNLLTAIEDDNGSVGPVTITDYDPNEDELAITIQTARFDTGGQTNEDFFKVETQPTDDDTGTEVLLNGKLYATLTGVPGISASQINRIFI